MKYCSKCGKEVLDEAEFCDRCGCKLADTTAKGNASNKTLNKSLHAGPDEIICVSVLICINVAKVFKISFLDSDSIGYFAWLIWSFVFSIVCLVYGSKSKDKFQKGERIYGTFSLIITILDVILTLIVYF